MELVEDRQPWTPTIRELRVDPATIAPLLDEALLQPKGASTNPANLDTPVDEDTAPLMRRFVDECIQPELLKYMETLYGIIPKHVQYQSWVRVTADGSGLMLHEHAGANLTCIVYLEGSDGDVVFQDPRGNAGRSYPMSIRSAHFQPQAFQAAPGRVLIFPSYLFHYVERHTPSLRAVLTTDVYLKDV